MYLCYSETQGDIKLVQSHLALALPPTSGTAVVGIIIPFNVYTLEEADSVPMGRGSALQGGQDCLAPFYGPI